MEDRAARRFVWGAWAVGVAAALWLVWSLGPRFPYQDDFALVAQLTGRQPVTWRWLWNGYNDHRYSLSWLILLGAHKLAGGDHRFAMTLCVAFLATAAALTLAALRKLRGRSCAWDAVIALTWLHWGHWWNLLMSFQLWLVLSTALVGVWTANFARSKRLTRPVAIVSALSLLALPLLAGSGALSTPPLALGALAISVVAWRSGERRERASATLLAAASVGALAIFVAYVTGFERSFNEANDDRVSSQLVTLAQFLSLAAGPSRFASWPAPAAFAFAMGLSSALLLLAAAWRRPDERVRSLALLGALGVVASLSIGIAWGRTAAGANLGQEVRYVTLLLPLTSIAWFTWELYGPATMRSYARALLGAVTLVGVVNGALDGWRSASQLSERAAQLETDVAAGLDSAELAERHTPWMFPSRFDLARSLAELRRAQLPPFDRRPFAADIDARAVGPFAGFDPQPDGGAPAKRILPRDLDGREVAALGEPGELIWNVEAGEVQLSAKYGLLPESVRKSDGVVFAVEARAPNAPTRVVFETELTPDPDRELQAELTLSLVFTLEAAGEIALVTRNAPGKHARWDRAYWADVTLR